MRRALGSVVRAACVALWFVLVVLVALCWARDQEFDEAEWDHE